MSTQETAEWMVAQLESHLDRGVAHWIDNRGLAAHYKITANGLNDPPHDVFTTTPEGDPEWSVGEFNDTDFENLLQEQFVAARKNAEIPYTVGGGMERAHGLAARYQEWERDNEHHEGQDYDRTRKWWRTWLGYAHWFISTDQTELYVVQVPPRLLDGQDAGRLWIMDHLADWQEAGFDTFRQGHTGNLGVYLDIRRLAKIDRSSGDFGEVLHPTQTAQMWAAWRTSITRPCW